VRGIGGSAAVACALALAACAACADGLATQASDPLDVTVERDGSLLQVRATLRLAAPAATCYAVLADYDHIDEFVPGMTRSEIVSPPGQPIRLHQVGQAGVGPFQVTLDVTLAVTEHPPTRIEFDRVAGNLERMRGDWVVSGDARRCGIAYRADIEPQFWVPPLLGPRLMRNQVEAQLHGLEAEILRRAAEVARP
jgi:ribosome-associated toxin RatA of RatAB toxin-antitoxin module